MGPKASMVNPKSTKGDDKDDASEETANPTRRAGDHEGEGCPRKMEGEGTKGHQDTTRGNEAWQ